MSTFDIIAITLTFIGFLFIISIPVILVMDDGRTWIWQKKKKESNSTPQMETK